MDLTSRAQWRDSLTALPPLREYLCSKYGGLRALQHIHKLVVLELAVACRVIGREGRWMMDG